MNLDHLWCNISKWKCHSIKFYTFFLNIVSSTVDTIWCHENVIFVQNSKNDLEAVLTLFLPFSIRHFRTTRICSLSNRVWFHTSLDLFLCRSLSLSPPLSLSFLLAFFSLGSQWQHNKCYAKTIFPTHQTNIPLCSVINALAFLFKARLCV